MCEAQEKLDEKLINQLSALFGRNCKKQSREGKFKEIASREKPRVS